MSNAKKTKAKKVPATPYAKGTLRNPSAATHNDSPRLAFLWATSFEKTAMLAKAESLRMWAPSSGTSDEKIQSMMPWVVNDAFAAEIYLKCLHLIHTKNMPWGHDLVPLFDALPTQCKHRMEKSYREHIATMKGKM